MPLETALNLRTGRRSSATVAEKVSGFPELKESCNSLTDYATVGHTVKRCRQPEEDTDNGPAETGEAASGQDAWGQDNEIETVRQRLDDNLW